jgi:hypothetical protein
LYLAAHHHIPGDCFLNSLCHKNLKAHFLKALHNCNRQLFCPTDEELADRKQTPDKKYPALILNLHMNMLARSGHQSH